MTSTTLDNAVFARSKNPSDELERIFFWTYLQMPLVIIVALLSAVGLKPRLTKMVPGLKRVILMPTTALGLEAVLTHELQKITFSPEPKKWLWPFVNNCFHYLGVSQGIRNRAKMCSEMVYQAGKNLAPSLNGRAIRIETIGCGLCWPVFHAAIRLTNEGIPVKLLLIDRSQSILDGAQKRAAALGIDRLVRTEKGEAEDLGKTVGLNFRPNITEIMGVAEYLEFFQLKEVFRAIFNNLEPGGYLVSGNVRPKIEGLLVYFYLGWKTLIYRFSWQTRLITRLSGFRNAVFPRDPHNFFTLIMAQKPK